MNRSVSLVPALVTPFTRVGDIDLDAHRRNLHDLAQRSIKGFLIAGSTGEGPYLEPGERGALLDAARDELGERPFLLCGVAAETLRGAAAQVEEAAGAGADAVLVMTPTSLVRGNHTAVEGFYTELADTSPLPVFLYSVPVYTGYPMPVDMAIRLSNHPNIIGMKDSGGDPVGMARLVEESADGFTLYTGSSKAVTLCIAAGAHGAITASANYVPGLVLDVVNRARRSAKSARQAQALLTRVSSAVEAYQIPGVKAAAEMTGLQPGIPRKPLRPLAAPDRRKVRDVLQREGLLPPPTSA